VKIKIRKNMYKDKNVQKEYQRVWMAKRRSDFFDGKKCEWCGKTKNLVIHHVNPKNKESHKIWSWCEERRIKELEKCIVLCEKCHMEYHASLLRTKEHGLAMYGNGCRCDICTMANRDSKREYRAKIKNIMKQ
jgi:5-methylcytosine-specific restriction endonuclease McrA